MLFYRQDGSLLTLNEELGTGGEATVYEVKGDKNLAAKIYHKATADRIRKLTVMLKTPPSDPTLDAGHVSIAWPLERIFDSDGNDRCCVGFIMTRLNTKTLLPLHQLYNPKARGKRAPNITWQYLVRIAHNLCTVVAALHAKGYVIGDLNESNILVSDSALVTLVDCDSLQVIEGRKVFRCTVGKIEYTAPELQGRDFKRVTRTVNHDNFALAVLIFMLLMEGGLPFAGIYQGGGDPPDLDENIRTGRSPYLSAKDVKPALVAPAFTSLPKDIRKLMTKALGRNRFSTRPRAEQWKYALAKLERQLVNCNEIASHCHSSHLKQCPWCERKEKLGLDAYPSDGTLQIQASKAHLKNISQKKSVKPPRPVVFLKRDIPLLSFTMLTALTALGWLTFDNTVLLSGWVDASFILGLVVFTILISLIGLFSKAKRSSMFYKRLVHVEMLSRSAVTATVFAMSITLLVNWFSGERVFVIRDWSLLISLWVVMFFVVWRFLMRRPRSQS